jgi:DNA polymerase-3 subunit beta
LIKADSSKLIIRATNLDLGIEVSIPAKIESEGEVAVPGSVLYNTLSNIHGSKNVTFELVKDNLVVSTEKNTIIVKCFNTEDFPVLPPAASDNAFTIDPKILTDGMRSVWYSAALSDIKPEISSVYMYYEDGFICFVSTDSFRLAEKKVAVKITSDFPGIILPIKNTPDIIRILDTLESDVIVSFDENQISFSSDDMYITSRIVNGIYPDYRQIIPTTYNTTCTVIKADLAQSLRLTNIFTDKFHKINISVTKERNILEISSRNVDVGENNSQIQAQVQGDDFSVNFNQKYINDCLQSISEDSLLIQYSSEREILVIQGKNNTEYTYIVKPMNR